MNNIVILLFLVRLFPRQKNQKYFKWLDAWGDWRTHGNVTFVGADSGHNEDVVTI